jgi:D-glycero-D-manno-heptose 1,7-bisphosphate phosphatase
MVNRQSRQSLIVLDRDGVLNDLVVDEDHGTIDSPLHPFQVKVYPWVPQALALLTRAGFSIVLATNQPSWAKRKTTQENLMATHEKVLEIAQSEGGRILKSYICFHKSEDQCECRKPRVGLLKDAFQQHPEFVPSHSWMVGDGVTDVQAGKAYGMKTGFLGPRKCDACKWLIDRGHEPDFWGNHLLEFSNYLNQSN